MRRKYRVMLDVGGTVHNLRRGVPGSARLQYERETGKAFFRAKITAKWEFVREDFDLIHSAPFDTTFFIIIEETLDSGATWQELPWRGEFYKTDCEFDSTNRRVSAKPRPKDNYSKVFPALEKELDLIKLGPAVSQVTYTKQPVIQVHSERTDLIMNFLQGTYWEQPFDREAYPEDPNDINSGYNAYTLQYVYRFAQGPALYIIPGAGNLNPDVSGVYLGPGNQTREDGKYTIQTEDIGAGAQVTIRDTDTNQVVYTAPPGEIVLDISNGEGSETSNNTSGAVLTSVIDPSSICNLFYWIFYIRVLTDLPFIPGLGLTWNLPDPDIGPTAYGYLRAAQLPTTTININAESQTQNSRYGQFDQDAVQFAGEFFKRLEPDPVAGINQAFPINRSYWKTNSAWFYYDDTIRAIQEAGAVTKTLRNAYRLKDVLQVILGELDDSITFDSLPEYSEFLYSPDGINPVSGEEMPTILFTPKTNILVSDYDQPAQTAPIKLQDIDTFLWASYRLKWFIDQEKRFRIEHISWFENGGTYSGTIVGKDLTNETEPKTGKKWSYRSSKWSYEKEKMPEEIRTKWMDKGSEPFDGFPIELRSKFVEIGNYEEINTRFTTDLDFMNLQSGDISKEGFAALAGFETAPGKYEVRFLQTEGPTNFDWNIQNGHLSFLHLHKNYHRHGLPGADIRINDEDNTALSVERNRIQETSYPEPGEPNTFALFRSELDGVNKEGQLREIEIDLSSRAAKIKISHDTE
jgi:hypothetical protein